MQKMNHTSRKTEHTEDGLYTHQCMHCGNMYQCCYYHPYRFCPYCGTEFHVTIMEPYNRIFINTPRGRSVWIVESAVKWDEGDMDLRWSEEIGGGSRSAKDRLEFMRALEAGESKERGDSKFLHKVFRVTREKLPEGRIRGEAIKVNADKFYKRTGKLLSEVYPGDQWNYVEVKQEPMNTIFRRWNHEHR